MTSIHKLWFMHICIYVYIYMSRHICIYVYLYIYMYTGRVVSDYALRLHSLLNVLYVCIVSPSFHDRREIPSSCTSTILHANHPTPSYNPETGSPITGVHEVLGCICAEAPPLAARPSVNHRFTRTCFVPLSLASTWFVPLSVCDHSQGVSFPPTTEGGV